MNKKVKITLYSLLTVLLCYISSYLIVSINGIYEPSSVGLAGIKGYHWIPYGFTSDYKARRYLFYTYFPLYMLDIRFWHTAKGRWYKGQYPTRKPDDDLSLYDKWN